MSVHLPPIRLLVELCRDIKHLFVPLVDDVLLFLVEMVEWKESSLVNLQIGFGGISWIFQFLQRSLSIDDVKRYYKRYFARFLGNGHYFVRDFMAEVFAAIVRPKVMLHEVVAEEGSSWNDNDKVLLLRHDFLSLSVRDYLFETGQLVDCKRSRQRLQIGLSVFLFQCVRGVLKAFHSKTAWMLPLMLRVLRRQRVHIDDEGLRARELEEARHQMVVFREFVDLAAVYTTTEHCERFARPLLETLQQHLLRMQAETDSDSVSTNNSVVVERLSFGADLDYLNRLLLLAATWTAHNGGEVVPIQMLPELVQIIRSLTDREWVDTVMLHSGPSSKGMSCDSMLRVN